MNRKRCYICTWRNPLAGWCAYLTDLEIRGYRLAGYIVFECA